MFVQKQNEQLAGNDKKVRKAKSSNIKDADIKALEMQIEETLGLKVNIHNQSNNSGEFRIKYKSLDQLDEICRRLSKGK